MVREAAEREGVVVAATGAHPFSQPEEQEIVQEERYLAMLAERPKARRQLVCGVHVHVGMRSFEECLATLEAILPWLPAVLALSVNSPYLEPVAPGVLSGRAARLLELPRAGPPPPLPDRETWERVVAPIGDYTRIWWDVRPHPRLGTLEIRIADQPTDVRRSAALAALLQALCVAAEPRDDPSIARTISALARSRLGARRRSRAVRTRGAGRARARHVGVSSSSSEAPPEAHRPARVGGSRRPAGGRGRLVARSG